MPLLSVSRGAARATARPFPFDRPGFSTWYNARAAIWQGARCLGLRAGDRVLVPAYACGSEIDALLKSGLELAYYRIRPDLTPDFDHLAVLVNAPARALYVIHYFGVSQPMDQVAAFARAHGLLLIEDNAHGLYSTDATGRALGSFGDMAVFSFTKTLAVPDGGGLLLGKAATSGPSRGRPPAALPVAGKMRFLIEQASARRFPAATAFAKRRVLDPLVAGLKAVRTAPSASVDGSSRREMGLIELKPERAAWLMSAMARVLLVRQPHEAVRRARRRHFQRLRELLDGVAGVTALLGELPDGCCPLFFPVQVDDAAGFQRALSADGVESKWFWSFIHDAVPMDDFPFERALKRSVVVLPVHQSLDEADLAVIARAVRHWGRNRPLSGR